MRRLSNMVAWSLALALAGAPLAYAGPKKGKKGKATATKPVAAPKGPPPSNVMDPMGDVGSGGAKNNGSAPAAGAAPQRGPTRIDFDDRLIQGQTNRSGAVYLYDRKELQTKSMVKKRESFRQEILSTVYDTP